MKIRKIKERDFKKGLLETFSNLSPVDLTFQKAKKFYQKIKNNPVYNIFVAESENKIVGTITLLIEQKFIHGGGRVGHIEDVAVKRGWEGKGIGSALARRAVAEAGKQGCYKVILDCSQKNIPFYKKLGFHEHETGMRLDL